MDDTFHFSIHEHHKIKTPDLKNKPTNPPPPSNDAAMPPSEKCNLTEWVCSSTQKRYSKLKIICKCIHLFPLVGDDLNWLIGDVYMIGSGLITQDVICQAVEFRCSSATVPPRRRVATTKQKTMRKISSFFWVWKICEGLWLRKVGSSLALTDVTLVNVLWQPLEEHGSLSAPDTGLDWRCGANLEPGSCRAEAQYLRPRENSLSIWLNWVRLHPWMRAIKLN